MILQLPKNECYLSEEFEAKTFCPTDVCMLYVSTYCPITESLVLYCSALCLCLFPVVVKEECAEHTFLSHKHFTCVITC